MLTVADMGGFVFFHVSQDACANPATRCTFPSQTKRRHDSGAQVVYDCSSGIPIHWPSAKQAGAKVFLRVGLKSLHLQTLLDLLRGS